MIIMRSATIVKSTNIENWLHARHNYTIIMCELAGNPWLHIELRIEFESMLRTSKGNRDFGVTSYSINAIISVHWQVYKTFCACNNTAFDIIKFMDLKSVCIFKLKKSLLLWANLMDSNRIYLRWSISLRSRHYITMDIILSLFSSYRCHW